MLYHLVTLKRSTFCHCNLYKKSKIQTFPNSFPYMTVFVKNFIFMKKIEIITGIYSVAGIEIYTICEILIKKTYKQKTIWKLCLRHQAIICKLYAFVICTRQRQMNEIIQGQMLIVCSSYFCLSLSLALYSWFLSLKPQVCTCVKAAAHTKR